MYCHQCEEKLLEDSRFCSRCGTETHEDDIKEEATVTETSIEKEELRINHD
ncbi:MULTISPECIES: zinc-ribbon domain-containing protein [unclassified Bacillus (in: firmicutes)]|uniref:zinc-ribbon domain-containing protein n=1 Tax=unclassified Bacillus (in: firmicutes) TaxID=185979 RepID=UPI002FFEF078